MSERLRFAALSAPSLFMCCLLLVAVVGCGGEDPKPYSATAGDRDRDTDEDEPVGGEGGEGDEAGSGAMSEGGAGGASGQGGEGGGGEGGAGGSGGGGRGGGGTGGSGGSGGSGSDEPDPPEVPDSPSNPWIAFTQYDVGSGFNQLYVVKADGTGLSGYKGDKLYENDPAWSNDGTKLAFIAFDEADGTELHVVDFEAETDEVLEVDLERISRPRWSPDDETLVVSASDGDDAPIALYRVDVGSGDHEALTEAVDDGGDTGHDIAPTGRVYFVRKDGAAYDVFAIMYDASPSTAPTRVTTSSGITGGVNVHPDSRHVVYARAAGTSTMLVEHAVADGTQRMVGEAGDEDASYFAGGDKLAISRDSFGGDAEVAVTDEDGVLVQRCTDDDDLSNSPQVSPIESGDVDLSVAF